MLDSNHPFRPHADVLEASVPPDSVSRLVLLNELKNRGKGAVQAQNWPDAVALYTKAAQVAESDDDVAIAQANLSLSQGKMHHWDAALRSAQASTQADAGYVKGWWRLAQAHAALQHWDEAVEALETATKLEPTNKALLKELEKYRTAKLTASTAKLTTTSASIATSTTPTVSSNPVAKTTFIPSEPAAMTSSSSPTKATTELNMDLDDGFTESDVVRGYKIVNGKKTSYFHNELTDETKQLIGDIAPKKLESVSGNVSDGTSALGSAWNQAGTWEEKDITTWAREQLEEQLLQCTYTWDSSVASITKAVVTGSASVAMVRGKKRYIYELALALDWNVNGGEAVGSIKFPDVDGTCVVGEPYEATDFSVSTIGSMDRASLETNVYRRGLRDKIHTAIDDWVGRLKDTY